MLLPLDKTHEIRSRGRVFGLYYKGRRVGSYGSLRAALTAYVDRGVGTSGARTVGEVCYAMGRAEGAINFAVMALETRG